MNNIAFNQQVATGEIGTGKMVGGPKVGVIEAAWVTHPSNQSKSIEINIDGPDGVFKFIKMQYVDKDGKDSKGGMVAIQNMMGLLRIGNLTESQSGRADLNGQPMKDVPELNGKTIGLFLQRRDYTTNGADKFGWNIKAVFDPQTKRTYNEALNKLPAEKLQYCIDNIEDIDARTANAAPQQAAPQQSWGNSAPQQAPAQSAPAQSGFAPQQPGPKSLQQQGWGTQNPPAYNGGDDPAFHNVNI